MITRYTPPFRSQVPPQWRGACAAVAGGGPNRATAIVVARLVFTISGQSRAFTALRLIDLVTAVHSHMNELATLEFGLQQLARLEDELAPDGAVPGPLMLALSSRTRIGTVERANAIAAATLPAEAQRRLTVMPIEITTGYRRPDGQWPPRCPVAWLVHEFNARVASHVDAPDPHDRRLGPDQFVVSLRHYRPAEGELSRERLKAALSTAEGLLLQPRGEGELIELSDDEAVAAAVMLPMVAADRLAPSASSHTGGASSEMPAGSSEATLGQEGYHDFRAARWKCSPNAPEPSCSMMSACCYGGPCSARWRYISCVPVPRDEGAPSRPPVTATGSGRIFLKFEKPKDRPQVRRAPPR